MNAPANLNNMDIWNAVAITDPAHTKKVNQRGGFTAISAHYQVMRATEQFGPVGKGWGYINGPLSFEDGLCIVPVTLWHGNRENSFGPVYGSAELRDRSGRLDSDAPKKAATDGLTKGLSHLGFNADVFLGRFDDSKYVDELRREFAGATAGEGHSPNGGAVSPPQQKRAGAWREEGSIYSTPSALHKALKQLERELAGCGDSEMVYALCSTDEWKEFVRVAEKHSPHYLRGGDPAPPEFQGLLNIAERMVREFDATIADNMAALART